MIDSVGWLEECSDEFEDDSDVFRFARLSEIYETAKQNARYYARNKCGGSGPSSVFLNSALFYAARHTGHEVEHYSEGEILEFFIQAGADVNAKNNDGVTPLHLAMASSGWRNVKWLNIDRLMAKNADVNALTNKKHAPLHFLIGTMEDSETNIVDCIAKLATAGAKVNVANHKGNTPLHLAATLGLSMSVGRLVELGANTNKKNRDGDTPLHFAALGAHAKNIEQLAVLGANIDAKNNDSKTPLQLAALKGHTKTVKTLTRIGAKY